MKKFKSIFYTAAAALAIASCGLLDTENPSNIYGSGFWNSKSEVEAYLTGTYTQFRSTLNTLNWFEVRSDNFAPGVEFGTSALWSQNLTSTNGSSWGSFYTVIQHCNMVIKNADKVKFTIESEKNNLVAQAYSMRAYMYFCLVRTFGDAPLELVPTEGSEKEKQPRAPKIDVLNQVLSDCETAVSLYSSDAWLGNKSLASKLGTYALMADAYLWKAKVLGGNDEDYRNVIKYADLAAAKTSLEDDYSLIYGTRNGPEIIWSIHFGYPEISGQYSSTLKLRDQFVLKAANIADIPYAKAGARSTWAPSEEFKAIVSKYPGDVRRNNAYVVAVDAAGNVLGTSDKKMSGTATETNRIYDNDIVLYRHSEMILFKAEAYAALGQTDKAIEQLDIVRKRAGIKPYSGATDKKAVELEILDERAREFWIENKRWPDLIRFHSEGVIDIYDVVPNLRAKKENGVIIPLYLAITVSEMSLNHKLVQTEGYENL
ncbi:MAG: RagB/SusD family nutrient uptake outer membrane protein [Bacteroidales bacterium]|nr:RagB/SusD family nutrient uptake outer membrane protein [Bacteroidales bacterium]